MATREAWAAAFGAVVRQRQLRRGISQEELAEASGVHRTFVSLLERGQRLPALDAVEKLARGLHLKGAADLVRLAEARLK